MTFDRPEGAQRGKTGLPAIARVFRTLGIRFVQVEEYSYFKCKAHRSRLLCCVAKIDSGQVSGRAPMECSYASRRRGLSGSSSPWL